MTKDSDGAALVGKTCGTTKPGVVTSTTNKVFGGVYHHPSRFHYRWRSSSTAMGLLSIKDSKLPGSRSDGSIRYHMAY